MNKGKVRLTESHARLLVGGGLILFLLAVALLFGKLHAVIFLVLVVASYQLTASYVRLLNEPERSSKCWPNILVLFDSTTDVQMEIRRKQGHSNNCNYIQKNPWVHLMVSDRLDSAIDEFLGLCLRNHINPWLSIITSDQSFVHEIRHVLRHLLSTVIRRLQNVDINACLLQRFLPLIFQTCDRYVHTRRQAASNDPIHFLRKMYKSDLHLAVYNRHTELQYLKQILLDLMPIIAPKAVYECKGSRHLLSELIVNQVLLDAIDTVCQPNILNRLFHLYFTTAVQRRLANSTADPIPSSNGHVEILSQFCRLKPPVHKNQLALPFKDVIEEKELATQFSRVLDRHGSAGLLSLYFELKDLLDVAPLAADMQVREQLYQRLKHIEDRYLNALNSNTYLEITNPSERRDTLIDEIKQLIENDSRNTFDTQRTYNLLLQFDCKVDELVGHEYQRLFLNSDEHFYYICGQRMDSPEYRLIGKPNTSDEAKKRARLKRYATTSFDETEEIDVPHPKYSEDTASIGSASSLDERDLSQWHVRIDRVEELRESLNTNSRYVAFMIEVQRIDSSTDSPSVYSEERPRCIVARRYQDFYLLEQKLTEFHGIFSDARLPPRRSGAITRNFDYLNSMRHDFEHFLRHLMSKPTLRNSELLNHFLTQPDDFTLPNGEIALTKVFRVVPRRLRTEKGQNLEPFLISLLNYVEPPKPKATRAAPAFTDIIEEKLQSSIYGNNANITEPFFEPLVEEPTHSTPGELDSAYDHILFIMKQVFAASPLLIHALDLLRIPLKNTFDRLFEHALETNMDELLGNEENIIDLIRALQDAIFPDMGKEKEPADIVNFEDVVAAASEFIPSVLKRILGEANVQDGLQTLLEHFQDPLLNKQLFYTLLDEVLFQLFPELRLRCTTSRSSTFTTA